MKAAPDTNHNTSIVLGDYGISAVPLPQHMQVGEDGDGPSVEDETLGNLTDPSDIEDCILDGLEW